MFTISLLFLFNMARGQGAISHVVWVAISSFIIFSAMPLWPLRAILWIGVTLIVTLRATGPTLLIGIRRDNKAIYAGFERNLPIVPLLMVLNSWLGLTLLLQGLVYYLCGKWRDNRATRLAEGITGTMLGVGLIS